MWLKNHQIEELRVEFQSETHFGCPVKVVMIIFRKTVQNKLSRQNLVAKLSTFALIGLRNHYFFRTTHILVVILTETHFDCHFERGEKRS